MVRRADKAVYVMYSIFTIDTTDRGGIIAMLVPVLTFNTSNNVGILRALVSSFRYRQSITTSHQSLFEIILPTILLVWILYGDKVGPDGLSATRIEIVG